MPMVKRKFTFTELTPELAYVIGVYLGDGCVSKSDPYPRYSKFTLEAIDLDFVTKTKIYCESFLGPLPEIKCRPMRGKGISDTYVFKFGSVEFCEWLVSVTGNKQHIPDIIPKTKCDITKNFLEGFLDSEGGISESKKMYYGKFSYHIHFGNCSKFIFPIVDLMKLQGLTITAFKDYLTQKGSVFYKGSINVKSFILSKFTFAAQRKQIRLEKYHKAFMQPSETMHQIQDHSCKDIVQTV